MGRFPILTDENTARGIAKALIDRGWDVARGVNTVAQGTHDDVLLLKAVELDRVLLTRDVDLEVIAHRWLRGWLPIVRRGRAGSCRSGPLPP